MQLFLCDLELDQIGENLSEFDYDIQATLSHLGLNIDPYRAMKLFMDAFSKNPWQWWRFDLYPDDDLRLQINGLWYTRDRCVNLWRVAYIPGRQYDVII